MIIILIPLNTIEFFRTCHWAAKKNVIWNLTLVQNNENLYMTFHWIATMKIYWDLPLGHNKGIIQDLLLGSNNGKL